MILNNLRQNSLDHPAFTTPLGQAIVGDSMEALSTLEPESVDLVITSPPFALLREKDYGNRNQDEYIDWLCNFAPLVHRVLRPTGSYIIDMGGAYQRGVPVRSLYNYRVLLRHVDQHEFHLAEEFFWHNPSKLPSPIEWVNKRKLRAKDSVNTVWWLSKTPWPKANVSNVLTPYSERMKTLLKDANKFYTPKQRPSGHDISEAFSKDNGGAIPSNLLQFPNTESNSTYLRLCENFGIKPHPARFPRLLPEFFIKFLTDAGDMVVDIFGGSGTTAEAAELLARRWKTMDAVPDYVRSSVFRFLDDRSESEVKAILDGIDACASPMIEPRQLQLL
jgi:site-specific DNA-methyltransferase (cytosine-N4-specific)